MFIRPAAIMALAVLAPASPPEAPDSVAAFGCQTPQAVASAEDWNTYKAYGQRSVAIIDAALANDGARLRKFVAPHATSTIFHYDAGVAALTGPEGVVDLVKKIAPRRYEVFKERGFPLPPVAPCGKTSVDLILTGRDQAFVVTFEYEGALLVHINAQDTDLIAGEFRAQSVQ